MGDSWSKSVQGLFDVAERLEDCYHDMELSAKTRAATNKLIKLEGRVANLERQLKRLGVNVKEGYVTD
jgi:hypothetical protein